MYHPNVGVNERVLSPRLAAGFEIIIRGPRDYRNRHLSNYDGTIRKLKEIKLAVTAVSLDR